MGFLRHAVFTVHSGAARGTSFDPWRRASLRRIGCLLQMYGQTVPTLPASVRSPDQECPVFVACARAPFPRYNYPCFTIEGIVRLQLAFQLTANSNGTFLKVQLYVGTNLNKLVKYLRGRQCLSRNVAYTYERIRGTPLHMDPCISCTRTLGDYRGSVDKYRGRVTR